MIDSSYRDMEINLEQQLAKVDPSVICSCFLSIGDMIKSDIIDISLRKNLQMGFQDLVKIFICAVKEGKIRIFHDKDIRQNEDGSFSLPSIDLRTYFDIFTSNDEVVSCMVACHIIDEMNSDFNQSSWNPRFETEEKAKKFIVDLQDFYTHYFLYELIPNDSPHIQPLINCIRRKIEYGSTCPLRDIVEKEFREKPFGCLNAYDDVKGYKDKNDFYAIHLGVRYKWSLIPGTNEWRYMGVFF